MFSSLPKMGCESIDLTCSMGLEIFFQDFRIPIYSDAVFFKFYFTLFSFTTTLYHSLIP